MGQALLIMGSTLVPLAFGLLMYRFTIGHWPWGECNCRRF